MNLVDKNFNIYLTTNNLEEKISSIHFCYIAVFNTKIDKGLITNMI
jgi:hypothetical protein